MPVLTRLRSRWCKPPLTFSVSHASRDVVGERAGQRVAEGELHERAHDRDVVRVRRQGVGGHHPAALGSELRRDVELVVVALARELEGHERQLLVVVAADQLELADRLDPFGEQAGVLLHRLHDVAVAVVPEADEVVVLGQHHRRARREVQRERGVRLAQVVLVEDEVLGQVARSLKTSQPMPG